VVIDARTDRRDDPAMLKRTLISGMWFVALSSLGGAMSVYLDVPRSLMIVPTIVGSVAIWIGLFRYEVWRATRGQTVTVRRVETKSTIGVPALEA
jgi:TRAP-type C4-dicarboxylate transport system permease small subunit